MMGVNFGVRQGMKILCLGAHCDDIEIGCGGSLLGILDQYEDAHVYWVVFSSDSRREKEARKSADVFLKKAGRKTVKVEKFRNGFFPYVGKEIKEYFEDLKTKFTPDLIFAHYGKDLHQDHRTISELTWNTFRNHLVLEYEIPKYDGDFGGPNFFISLDASDCRRKVDGILNVFRTQLEKHWLTEDLLYSVLRLRGMECASPTKYAEAFYCRKSVIRMDAMLSVK